MVARQGSKGTQSSRESVSEKMTPDTVVLRNECRKQGQKTFQVEGTVFLYGPFKTKHCNLYLVNSTEIYMYVFPFLIVFGFKGDTFCLRKNTSANVLCPAEQATDVYGWDRHTWCMTPFH